MSDPQNIAGSGKYHWWYDSNKAGVRNPPPMNMSGSPPVSPGAAGSPGRKFSLTSMLVGAADSVPTSPNYNPARRDSLKNMYVMNDFGTPDN